jgi:hypothetical protein
VRDVTVATAAATWSRAAVRAALISASAAERFAAIRAFASAIFVLRS